MGLLGCGLLIDGQQGPHHVVFLMLQDVAVMDVLVHDLPRIHVGNSRATGEREGHLGQVELDDHPRHLAWIHPDGFLPI